MLRSFKFLYALAPVLVLFPALDARAVLPEFGGVIKQANSGIVNISTTQTFNASPANIEVPPQLPPEGIPLEEFLQGPPVLPEEQELQALGSGFVIGRNGEILTNAHVVKDAEEITVRFPDRSEKVATLVGLDERLDIALLKVDAKGLHPVKIGNSDKLEVGQWVLALGSPFGLDYSATQGIISALGRNLPGGSYVPFIQTDAAVNPGNSGGPLLNTAGEVIGVNSQIYSPSGGYMGLSFAIPINVAMRAAEQLREHGKVRHGWLGVSTQSLNRDLAESLNAPNLNGALVAQVTPGSPAAQAGIEPGDIILRYDGKPIASSIDLPPLVGETPIGKEVELELRRQGKHKVVTAKIEEIGDAVAIAEVSAPIHAPAGLSVRELTPDEREVSGLSNGVIVESVLPGPARSAGVRDGDVILKAGGTQVRRIADLERTLQNTAPGKALPLLVHRAGTELFVALRMPRA